MKKAVKPEESVDVIIERKLKTMGNRLQQLRKAKGFNNYEKFAYENDIPRAQYGRYERGQDLKLSSLIKVLEALDISLKDFFAEGFE